MSDLIRREDVAEALYQAIRTTLTGTFTDSMSLAIAMANNLPSAETKQKGKWVRRKDKDCWECSECHAVLESDDIVRHNFYYCYHCGTDMMNEDGYMKLEGTEYE